MKKILLLALAIASVATANAAPDITELLGKVKDATTQTSGQEKDNSEQNSGSGILGGILSTVQNATASSKFTVDDLNGTWSYTSPAVSFKSDDALKKIGGAAAATKIENELEPYYKNVGLNNVVLTVDAEHNFTMKLKFATLKGTVEKDGEELKFNFSAFGKIKLGSMNARATKSGSTLNLTFDVTTLINILQKVSSVAKMQSLTAISKLLGSYDGLYAGFRLKKQKD